jgi:hypothetical protein
MAADRWSLPAAEAIGAIPSDRAPATANRQLYILYSAFLRESSMHKIWLTTDGRPHDSILGVFTTEAAAKRYRDLLVERYALGKNLSLSGRQLARDADAWRLGLGPDVVERTIDDRLEFLRGAWVVKVDETCRMIACEFSTKLKPNQPPSTYRVGIHRICQAHAMTPQAALDAARKAMVAHLGRART